MVGTHLSRALLDQNTGELGTGRFICCREHLWSEQSCEGASLGMTGKQARSGEGLPVSAGGAAEAGLWGKRGLHCPTTPIVPAEISALPSIAPSSVSETWMRIVNAVIIVIIFHESSSPL